MLLAILVFPGARERGSPLPSHTVAQKVAHADGDVRVGSLVRAETKDLFKMLDPLIVLASPQPDVAAHIPPTRIARV